MFQKTLAILFTAALLPAAAQSTGYLKAPVHPGRAGVFIDGKYVGPARNFGKTRKYVVPVGEHEVRLSEPRYEDLVTKVNVEAGKTAVVDGSLKALPVPQPPFGKLRIRVPDKFAAVYLNNKYMGHGDEFSNFSQGILLKPGTYEVKVEPTGSGSPIVKTVTIEAGKTVIVE